MNNLSRRSFLGKSVKLTAAGLIAPSILNLSSSRANPRRVHKTTIGIAQWALVNEIREGKWTNLDFPRIAREDFGIGAIEFVNTLWEVPTMNYLNRLKQNADNYEVAMVGIACDAEGDACSLSTKDCRQFAINHRKWIDAAQYLGCKAIRINCIGPRDGSITIEEALKRSAESCNFLLEYAIPANIVVLVENHGGVSNDPDFMVSLMKEVNSLYLGVLPDWRRPTPEFDNYKFLEKTLPYSGISTHFRPQPTEEHTVKMIQLCMDSGFSGYYCIESGPREEIKKGKETLSKYLNI